MKVAVVIPVFNHGGTIGRVVADARARLSGRAEVGEIIVVDDGSTSAVPEMDGVTILRHSANRGKGCALLTGFRYAASRGFTHAVTIDADGQHDAADIPRMLDAVIEDPDNLIIGWRDMESAGRVVPRRSKKGRDAARFWLRVQTGQDIPDSQCGLRVYPLKHVLAARRYWFGRFDFETEVLARMAWSGLKIRSIPVKCIYFSKARRISHFRPVVDTARGVRVNVLLVGRRLWPMSFPQLVERPEPEETKFNRWWRWSTWKSAVQAALRAGSSNSELASSFAMGIFVGITPFLMFQTLLAIYFSRRLHLNVLAAVIGSQISIPPLAGIWWALSYAVGNWVTRGEWMLSNWAFSWEILPTFLIGNILLASTMGATGLLAARSILGFVRAESLAEQGIS